MSTLLEMRIDELEEQNAALIAERAALAAQVEALRKALAALSVQAESTLQEDIVCHSALKRAQREADEVLCTTPQQRLAEIRAEAVLRFAGHVLAQYRYDVTNWASQYADAIRQEMR